MTEIAVGMVAERLAQRADIRDRLEPLVDAVREKAPLAREQADLPVAAPAAPTSFPSEKEVAAPHPVRLMRRTGEHPAELFLKCRGDSLVRVERENPEIPGLGD